MNARLRQLIPSLLAIVMVFSALQALPSPATATQNTGSIRVLFRGCPDGPIYPYTNSLDTCTIPLDAPDEARLIWGMEDGAKVSTAPRQNDGTYVLDGIPAFQHVGLAGFEPSERDAFHMTGTDYMSQPGYPAIRLARGDERQVWVFYYYEGGGDSSSASYGTIDFTLRGCPDGVDPTTSADPYAECTVPLDAPEFAG